MERIGDSTTTANGAKEFTQGQPGSGVDATILTAQWLNAIQRELINIVTGSGLAVTPGDDSQLLKAIQTLLTAAVAWAKVTGKPTTVAGFGITDAFTKTEVSAAIQKAVADLVASSPAALDTLNELATALGNDPNFATTMNNALAGKAAKATTLAGYGILDAYSKSSLYSRAEVDELLKNVSALPIGSMIPFPKEAVPPGFLELDGSVQSTATYPDLAAYLGTSFNKGDEGAGSFRLPESRGEFLRGWDHGRGVDAGRTLGAWQSDDLKTHSHGLGMAMSKASTSVGNGSDMPILSASANVTTNATGGVETRPRNLAVMWCIKAWSAQVNQGNVDVAALAALAAQATETGQGTLKIATDAMLVDGTDNKTAVSPKKLRLGFSFSNNSIALPTWLGGWIVQWGATTAATVTFPQKFPTSLFHLHLTINGWNSTSSPAGQYETHTSTSQTGFTVATPASSLGGGSQLKWIAFGN